MANSNTYDPFLFQTGLSQIRGAFGGPGLLAGVKDKVASQELMDAYLQASGATIGGTQRKMGRIGIGSKLAGLGLTHILKKAGMKGAINLLGLAVPHAAILGGITAGLGDYFFKKKAARGVEDIVDKAPDVKYGKRELQQIKDTLSQATSSLQESIAPSAVTTAFNVPLDVLKIQQFATGLDSLRDAATGMTTKRPESLSNVLGQTVMSQDYLTQSDKLLNLIGPQMSGTQRTAWGQAFGPGGNVQGLLSGSSDMNRLYEQAVSLRPYQRSFGLGG